MKSDRTAIWRNERTFTPIHTFYLCDKLAENFAIFCTFVVIAPKLYEILNV